MRQLLQVALVAWFLSLVACTSMVVGDAVLGAQGKLVLPEGTAASCTLALSLEESQTSPAYYSRTIRPGAFRVDFTIEPAVRDYRLKLECPGHEVIERAVRSNRAETRVDLGILEPRRTR